MWESSFRLEPLSLRVNFSWTFVGNVIYAGCQWGMLSVLAKLGTPEMVGRFSLGLAVTAPVIMLTNLQLRAVQATDAKREYNFADYLGLRLVMTMLALLIVAGIVLVVGYQEETALVIMVVGLAKAFESISDIFYGLLQQRERMDRIATSMIVRGILSLTVLSATVYVTRSVLWGTLGLALTWALVLLSYDVRNGTLVLKSSIQGHPGETTSAAMLRPRWEIETMSKLAWLSFPLGVVMMLISLNSNIPWYFVEWYWGERELGIFSAMVYLVVAGNTVVNALGQSASPRLAKYYALRNRAGFRMLLLKLEGIGVLLGMVGVTVALVAGREILTLLYTPDYGELASIFVWVMAAAAIGYAGSFLGYGITATRAFSRFIIPYLIITAITVGSSWFLIPTFGLIGAAWTLCVLSLAYCIMPIIILSTVQKPWGRDESPSQTAD